MREKIVVITLILEDSTPLDTAGYNVLENTWSVEAGLTWHEWKLQKCGGHYKLAD